MAPTEQGGLATFAVVVLTAGADEAVRAEPFDAIELRVGVLFGDDDPDDDVPE